jgi:uncharacterized membrane protein YeaQ/YmgE (transglycosylase-associated protein family)
MSQKKAGTFGALKGLVKRFMLAHLGWMITISAGCVIVAHGVYASNPHPLQIQTREEIGYFLLGAVIFVVGPIMGNVFNLRVPNRSGGGFLYNLVLVIIGILLVWHSYTFWQEVYANSQKLPMGMF